MDRYAAAHHGLAPVVVMPDTLGTPVANPLCLDSRLGRVETYLSVDVPAWIARICRSTPTRRGGRSAGTPRAGLARCSWPCAPRACIRGSSTSPVGPNAPLGDRRRTIAAACGGDVAAFIRVNPLDVLRTARFPHTAGMLVVGRDDAAYRPQHQAVAAACQRAGMSIRAVEQPGGHTWGVWGPGLDRALPWLGCRR